MFDKANLMICRHQFTLLVDVSTLPFAAHDDAVLRPFKMRQHHFLESLFGSLYSGLAAKKEKLALGQKILVFQ
jgi:hypothetical protein